MVTHNRNLGSKIIRKTFFQNQQVLHFPISVIHIISPSEANLTEFIGKRSFPSHPHQLYEIGKTF